MYKIKIDIVPKLSTIGFVDYKSPWIHFKRTTDEYIIYIIKTGDLYLRIEGKEYHLQPNDILFIPKGKYHEGYKKASCSYYYIHFYHTDITEITVDTPKKYTMMMDIRKDWMLSTIWDNYGDDDFWIYLPPYFQLNDTQLSSIFNVLDRALNIAKNKKEFYKYEISSLINQVMIKYSRAYISSIIDSKENKKNLNYKTIINLMQYINQNYSSKITLSDIEYSTLFNYDYINRLFKEETDYTIMEYLTKVRIDKAKFLSMHTTMKYYEIGKAVGYDNQYYFSRVFRKTTGMTLSEYTKTYRSIL